MIELLIIFQIAVAVVTVAWVVSNIIKVDRKAIATRLSRVPALNEGEAMGVVTPLRPISPVARTEAMSTQPRKSASG